VVAAASAALALLRAEPSLMARLHSNTTMLQGLLDPVATENRDREVPIAPVVLGDARRTMAAEQALWEQGWMVHGLRPPTVPVGASRLRVTVSAAHREDELRGVAAAVHALVA
jgi:7-keto-8-aminopelargonate synthetase-like enzyme